MAEFLKQNPEALEGGEKPMTLERFLQFDFPWKTMDKNLMEGTWWEETDIDIKYVDLHYDGKVLIEGEEFAAHVARLSADKIKENINNSSQIVFWCSLGSNKKELNQPESGISQVFLMKLQIAYGVHPNRSENIQGVFSGIIFRTPGELSEPLRGKAPIFYDSFLDMVERLASETNLNIRHTITRGTVASRETSAPKEKWDRVFVPVLKKHGYTEGDGEKDPRGYWFKDYLFKKDDVLSELPPDDQDSQPSRGSGRRPWSGY